MHDLPVMIRPRGYQAKVLNDESAAQRLKMASVLSSTFIRQFYKRDGPVSLYKYCVCVKNLQAVQGVWRGKPEEKMWKAGNLVL